jgi:hypothetical protein
MNTDVWIKDESEVINKIKNISEDIDKELDKDEIDKERLFKLRYQQFIQGLYLTQNPLNNK